mmetsp:Transcript_7900/g.19716  ORF Transcript_7900/g.19716 Transcript_7900/m.19716 type:complete len:140 (-) Transcript_7900:235-654(-)
MTVRPRDVLDTFHEPTRDVVDEDQVRASDGTNPTNGRCDEDECQACEHDGREGDHKDRQCSVMKVLDLEKEATDDEHEQEERVAFRVQWKVLLLEQRVPSKESTHTATSMTCSMFNRLVWDIMCLHQRRSTTSRYMNKQ